MKQHFYQRYIAFLMAVLIIMAQASGVVLAEDTEGGSDTTVSQAQNDSGAAEEEPVDSGINEPKSAASSANLLGSFAADGISGGSSETDATEITEKETTIKIEGSERYFKFTAEKSGTCTFKLDCTSNFIVIVTDQNVSTCLEQYDPTTSVNQTFSVNAGTTYYIDVMSDDGCAYDANLTLDGCFAEAIVQIGDTGYKTWAEAVTAINNDTSLSATGDVSQATITLLSDVAIDGGTSDVSAGEMPTKPCTIVGTKSSGGSYKLSSPSTDYIFLNANTRFYDIEVDKTLFCHNYKVETLYQLSIGEFTGTTICGNNFTSTKGAIVNITGNADTTRIGYVSDLNLSSAAVKTSGNYVNFDRLNLTGTNHLLTGYNSLTGIIDLYQIGTITGTGELLIENNSTWTPHEGDTIIKVRGTTDFAFPSDQLAKIKLSFSDGKTWMLKRTVDTNCVNYVLAAPVASVTIGGSTVNYSSFGEAVEAINNDSTLSETGDVSQVTMTLLSDVTIDGGTHNVSAGEMPAKPCTIVGTKSSGGKYILTSSTDFIYINTNTKFYDIEIGKSLCNNSYILSSHQITIERFKGTDNIWGYDPSNTSNIVNVSGDAEAVSIQNIHALNLSAAHITTFLGCISLKEINLTSTNELVANENHDGILNFYSTARIAGDGELVIKNGSGWTPAEGNTIIKVRNTKDYKIPSDQLAKIKLSFSDGKTWALKRTVDTANNCVNYVLAAPVASVTIGGTTVNYSSFGEAAEAINNDATLSATGDVSQAIITLLSDVTIDGGTFNVSAGEMPAKPCTIVGTKSGGGKYKLASSSYIFLNANTKFYDIQADDQLHCLGYNRSLYQVTIEEFTGTDIMGDGRPSTPGDIVNITGNVDITSIQNVTGLNLSTASIKISGGCISFNALNLTGTNRLLTRRNNNTGILYCWQTATVTGSGELLIENNPEWTPAVGDTIIKVDDTTDFAFPSDQLAKIKLAFNDGKTWILKRTVDTAKNCVNYVLARAVAEVDLQITPGYLTYGGNVTLTATLKDSDGNPLDYDGTMDFEGPTRETTTAHSSGAFTLTYTKPGYSAYSIKAIYTYSDAFICSQNEISSTFKSFEVDKSSNLSVSPTPGTITVPTAVSTEETKEYRIYLPDVLKLSQQDTGTISYSSAIKTNADSLIKEISTSGNTLIVTTNGGKADKTAEIDVTIETFNYNDITQTLTLKGSSSTPVMHGENIKANGSLTYGNCLSTISVTGEIYNEASQARNGTFRWDDPDAVLGDVGSNLAAYTWYPDDSSDGQYRGTVDVTVIPYELMVTLSPGSFSKIYGESDPTFTYNITMGWLCGSDTLEEPVLVSDGNTGGAHNVVANSQKNTNYAIAVSNGANAFTVNKRELTLDSVTVADKTYNGLTTVPDAAVTFGNVVSGDAISYTTNSTLYDSADVGTHSTNVSVILQGSSVENYVIAGDNPIAKTSKIVKATTTANGDSMQVIEGFSKAYSFDLDSLVLNDVGGSKSAGTRTYHIQSSTGSLSFASAPTVNGHMLEFTTNNAATTGQAKTVNITIQSTNYEDVTVQFVITAIEKTQLTISGMTVTSKAYDGKPVSSSGVLAFKNGSAVVAIASPVIQYSGRNGTVYSSTDAPTDAGDYTLTVSVPLDNQYRGSRTTDFTISKAALTVKPKNLSCYVGNTLPTAELVYTGFVNGETAATALTSNTLSATHTAANTNTAGTFDINVTGSATAKNYAITTPKATLTVSPKIVLTISGMTVTSKTYDGTPVSPSGALAFKKDSASVAIASPVVQYSGRNGTVYSSSDAPTDAGDYTLTVSVPTHDMYEGSRATDFTISKAALTVKPKNLSCYVGNTMPTPALDYIGFANGETPATALTGNTLAATHTAANTNTAGTFDINVTGSATAKNYAITTAKATLTVSPKIVLTISGLTVTSKTYDGTPVSLSGSIAFKKDSAVVAIASPVIQYSGRNGTVYSSTDAPTDAGDYTLTVSVPTHDMYEGSRATDFTISKAALTVKPKNLFCYVGNTMPTPELVYTGFVNGETAAKAFVGTLSATHAAANTNTAGIFDINVTGSATAKNYTIITEKATLTIRAINGNASQTELNGEITLGLPHATAPGGSLPTGVDISNLRLLVDPLSQNEMSVISSVVAANMPASIPSGQIVAYGINFIDVAHNNAVVEPTGAVVITLPYPSGTNSSYTFTMLHLVGGTEPEILPCTNTANGIQFTVSSLSPFIIGYTKAASSSHGHSSASRDNTAEVFWQSVEDNIQKAHAGDVISANVSSNITNIPASVLETLKGKDVTLTISWQSDKIAIYGKTMKDIEKNRIFYNLGALASLYQEEVLIENPPFNPETGGKVNIAQPSVVIDADQIHAEYAIADAKVLDENEQEAKVNLANETSDSTIIQKEQESLQASNDNKLFVAAIVAMVAITSAALVVRKRKS